MSIKLTEKQIESQILQWLNAHPDTFAFKVNTVGIFDPVRKIYRKNKNPFIIPGTSDIIGIRRGKFFAIEVKRPKQKATEDQLAFLNKIEQMKGMAFVAHSLDEVIHFFNAFLFEKNF